MNKRLFVSLVFILGLLLVAIIPMFGTVTNVNAVTPEAGLTIKYKVTTFTIPANEDSEVNITGSLEGSTLYVKLARFGARTYEYYNPDTGSYETDTDTIADYILGFIFANDITIETPSVDEPSETESITIPAGAGFILPVIIYSFTTVPPSDDAWLTDTYDPVVFMPFILTTDWSNQKTAFEAIGGTVTETTDEFTASFTNANGSDSLDATWFKSDGILKTINAHFDNEGNPVDIVLDYESSEVIDLSRSKTHFEFKSTIASFDYSVTDPDAEDELNQTKTEFESMLNKIVLKADVDFTDGLYYVQTGESYDPSTGTYNDMGAFDAVGYAGLYIGVPNVLITPDYELYDSLAVSYNAIVQAYMNAAQQSIQDEFDTDPYPETTITFNEWQASVEAVSNANFHYMVGQGSINIDFVQYDSYASEFYNYHIDASYNSWFAYTNDGVLAGFHTTFSLNFKVDYNNGTVDELNLNIDFKVENTDLPAPLDEPSAGGLFPSIPGFELTFAILGIIGAAAILLRKRH